MRISPHNEYQWQQCCHHHQVLFWNDKINMASIIWHLLKFDYPTLFLHIFLLTFVWFTIIQDMNLLRIMATNILFYTLLDWSARAKVSHVHVYGKYMFWNFSTTKISRQQLFIEQPVLYKDTILLDKIWYIGFCIFKK